MRRIFLVRHGTPAFPGGVTHCCLGRNTDMPLTDEGARQAARLSECFDFIKEGGFYASPLLRSRQTAEILARGRGIIKTLPGVEELDCGKWEGMSFDEIRRLYPEIYELRKNDMSIPPPGGETFDSAADRALDAIKGVLAETEEDAVIVAHAGVNRAVICRILGIPMRDNRTIDQRYACVNVLTWENGRLSVSALGRMAESVPDEREINELLDMCGTPDNVRCHCEAVARRAAEMAEQLSNSGRATDRALLEAGARLHDMCRTQQEHPEKAAYILRTRGYLRLADIVEKHHDCPAGGAFDEAKLLYLADKLTKGDLPATLDERFDASLERCSSQAARAANSRRRIQAYAAYDSFIKLTGVRYK